MLQVSPRSGNDAELYLLEHCDVLERGGGTWTGSGGGGEVLRCYRREALLLMVYILLCGLSAVLLKSNRKVNECRMNGRIELHNSTSQSTNYHQFKTLRHVFLQSKMKLNHRSLLPLIPSLTIAFITSEREARSEFLLINNCTCNVGIDIV